MKYIFIFCCLLWAFCFQAQGQIITTFAGNGTYGYSGDGGPATAAEIDIPYGMAIDRSGNIYFTDGYNMRIRKITPAGIITTVAGNGTQGHTGDGGPATAAEINYPFAVAVDTAGNLYFNDWYECSCDEDDTIHNKIRKVNAAGIISTIAGSDTYGDGGDGGPATAAQLPSIYGLAADNSGNIYISAFLILVKCGKLILSALLPHLRAQVPLDLVEMAERRRLQA